MNKRSVLEGAGEVQIWVEKNGVIRATVVSGGMGREEWVTCLEEEGCTISTEAKKILLSPHFVPTPNIRTELIVLRSSILPCDERYTVYVHEEALSRRLAIPDIEAACLFCKAISKTFLEETGLRWIAPMHTPVVGFENNWFSLVVEYYEGVKRIDTHDARDYASWDDDGGFVYKVPS